VFFDYFGDSLQSPKLGAVAIFAGAFQKQFLQLLFVLLVQPGRSSRRAVGLKKSLALFFIGLPPLGYGSRCYANESCSLIYSMALLEQSNGFSPPMFQLVSCSYGSHAHIIGTILFVYLIFQRAIKALKSL